MNEKPRQLSPNRHHDLDRLRQRIRTLERTPALVANAGCGTKPDGPDGERASAPPSRSWQFGIDSLDRWIGPPDGTVGLDTAAVHEIKPIADSAAPAAACLTAARGFVLALASRLDAIPAAEAAPKSSTAAVSTSPGSQQILWCTTRARAHEFGSCHGPGLGAFGIDPGRFLFVETGRADEVLWALEEGLRSGAIALAVGFVDEVALTPARRLALAAAERATPCLLLTHPARSPAISVATRWRVAPAPGAPNPFDPRVPGAARFAVRLERCRARPLALADRTTVVEWCDASFRFRLAAGAGDRAVHLPRSQGAAG